ncbi:MAG: G8 domain-containing protein, partial [Planctomycetota bacterium]
MIQSSTVDLNLTGGTATLDTDFTITGINNNVVTATFAEGATEANITLEIIDVMDGDWSDPTIWDDGVPTLQSWAIIGHGVSVELDGTDHYAKELVIHGDLVVPEDVAAPDKSLETNWVHINSGGELIVGSENDRYDEGTFTLHLTGTDKFATQVVETNMNGMMPGTMEIPKNDGFLMTGMGGRFQFYGEDKLSFTKLHSTVEPNSDTIIVENVIERNFNQGDMNGDDFVTSPIDDGTLNWEVGDEIVIASSSYDYTEEEVRTIVAIEYGDETSSIRLNAPLSYRHYGSVETYDAAGLPKSIDMRAEVALLSRNIKVQGLESQDTDVQFGDRASVQTEARERPGGLSEKEYAKLPPTQVANGVGGHIMIMPGSGQIIADGVQLDGLGQASHKGRYPIHWHLGGDRSIQGDVLRNSSITNSNNRGVTIHGTDKLRIEGVVLHDIHGHGFFFEDAVETRNQLIGNLVLGIHTVGGDDDSFADPGDKDPFVVDTHDSARETQSRFSSSAAFWITNPYNVFVGNIAAGAGDSRDPVIYDYATPGPAGTGFWYAIPRTAVGLSSDNPDHKNTRPIFAEFGQFDYNTSHTTAIGLNFDRGSDIEDSNFDGDFNFDSVHQANEYEPRTDPNDPNSVTTNFVNGFTNYKAAEAAMYHRGKAET